MLQTISSEELDQLSNQELASRMDQFICDSVIEKYGNIMDPYQSPSRIIVNKIFQSKHVQNFSIDKQREVCWLAFNTTLQLEYTLSTSTFKGVTVFGNNFSPFTSWRSPLFQINYSALRQFLIISSRITMECFMQLLYFLGEGERIKAKKSTFKHFKNWLNNSENPFSYFAVHLLKSYLFDRNHRTPEIHAATKLSKKALTLHNHFEKDETSNIELTNLMLNVWGPLIEILNDSKSFSHHFNDKEFDWFNTYLNGTNE
ncbi:hypothetical protein [Leptospira alexanderi]|uniref:hypothetical protein n=1 Tax=Leptospira alexanderi TaxID=100053 RepID=UPI000990E7C8|nr:hypothetical protein [Leptospira alexanderi]